MVAVVPEAAYAAAHAYTGPTVAIPDAADLSGNAPGSPAPATITVAGEANVLTDINFRFDGSACSTTAGSTTVGLSRTFANDLEVGLTSPAGTTVKLIDNTDGSGNNFCQTLLDDDAGAANIQTAVTANAPFTGTWAPANPLSAFDGQSPNGTWTLKVQDFFSSDTGTIRAWSLSITSTNAPLITGIDPARGPVGDGKAVTITGFNFASASAVDFDGVAAGFNVVNDTTIEAVAPAHATPGLVHVHVTNPTGTSAESPGDQFEYVIPAVVSGLSPAAGPAAGGTTVVITGSGFNNASGVTFDKIPAAFIVNSDNQITATSPPHARGHAKVRVSLPFANAPTYQNFNYVQPIVTSVAPTTGPTAGGNTVVIRGTQFVGVTAVMFGDTVVPTTDWVRDSNSRITVKAPAHVAGTVNVRVVASGATSADTAADDYTYA